MIKQYYNQKGERRFRLTFRLDHINPETGRRKSIKKQGFKTSKEAKECERRIRNEYDEFGLLDSKNYTFEDVLKLWFKDDYSPHKSQRTIQDRLYTINKILINNNNFRKRKIDKIDHFEVKRFFNSLVELEYSSDYVRKIYRMTKGVFDRGIKMKLIKENPCEDIQLPAVNNKEKKIWSVDEMRMFLSSSKDHPTYIFFLLALNTGARRSEVMGLKWADIDLTRGFITFNRSLVRQRGEGLVFGKLKSKNSYRTVSISDAVIKELEQHKKHQEEKKQLYSGVYQDEDLVISTVVGNRYDPANISRVMNDLVQQAGVRKIGIHDLRHTHASHLITNGVNYIDVSRKLGHRDPSVTLKVYSHITEEKDRTADVFQSILDG